MISSGSRADSAARKRTHKNANDDRIVVIRFFSCLYIHPQAG